MRFCKYFILWVIIISMSACGGGGGDDSGDIKHCLPTITAGADKAVEENQSVTLSAGNVSWCGNANFLWTQTDGTSVVLNNPSSMNSATFTAPKVAAGKESETLIFRFSLTDSDGQIAATVVKVNVYRTGFLTQNPDLSGLYDRIPNTAVCDEGFLKVSEKQTVLEKINAIRSLHKLPSVSYDSSNDTNTAKAALMIAANNETSHQPNAGAYCSTDAGRYGLSKSNLYIRVYQSAADFQDSLTPLIFFFKDENSEILGQRRALLDPFLKSVSFGRVDGKTRAENYWNATGIALMLQSDPNADMSGIGIGFIAYPFEDYPKEYFAAGSDYFSFSVLTDYKASANNKAVDFSGASVRVSDEAGNAVYVHGVSFDNLFYGLPNLLKWKAETIVENAFYTVRIQNVIIKDESRNFEYRFRLK
jgi:hypothetical protein